MPLTSMVRPNGPRVRAIRRRMDLTQEEMARRLHRSRALVLNIEAGRPVSKIVMRQLARSLRVSFSEITLASPADADGEQEEAEAA